METYFWTCDCGKHGRKLVWHKMVRAMMRHNSEHERKLQWNNEVNWEKVGA